LRQEVCGIGHSCIRPHAAIPNAITTTPDSAATTIANDHSISRSGVILISQLLHKLEELAGFLFIFRKFFFI
jgi:hypothetical protein